MSDAQTPIEMMRALCTEALAVAEMMPGGPARVLLLGVVGRQLELLGFIEDISAPCDPMREPTVCGGAA